MPGNTTHLMLLACQILYLPPSLLCVFLSELVNSKIEAVRLENLL